MFYVAVPPLVLVIIRAAEIVAALGTHKLAAMAGETMRAGGAHLAVVVDRQVHGRVARRRNL